MSAVRIIWKCNRPKSAELVRLYEQLMTSAARARGMDTAVIRHGIHDTTRVNGVYVKTVPHITGDIVNLKDNVGYALHYNIDTDKKEPIPATRNAPNPELWSLKHKKGKGFVLIVDNEEILRDID